MLPKVFVLFIFIFAPEGVAVDHLEFPAAHVCKDAQKEVVAQYSKAAGVGRIVAFCTEVKK
ncbi:MAG: hypothetical protein ACPGO3_12470 [Magnetospiraceae bacterium]